MKRFLKRGLCVLLSLIMLFSCVTGALAVNDAYPGDVTEAAAGTALQRTDTLVKNAMSALLGKTLYAVVCEALFANDTLSGILLGVYGAMDDRRAAMTTLGIDVSPAALAAHLKGYPSIASRLKKEESWSDVDLDGAKWNVGSRSAFGAAMSAIFAPMNDLLYMLLCGGTARLGLLPVRGDYGYEKGIVPILRAFGCPNILSPSAFCSQAASSRSAMIKNLCASLFSLVDAVCAAPAAKLTALLPGLSIFIRDGGLEKAVDAVLRPLSIHIGPYIDLFSGSKMLSVLLFMQSPGTYTMDFTANITVSINKMLSSTSVRCAEIDLDGFSACKGKPAADCFMVLLRWLMATLRLNKDELGDLTGLGNDVMPVANGLFRHSDEWLISTYVHLLTDAEGTFVEVREKQAEFHRGKVDFTRKLGRTQMKRVLSRIDDVLGEFTAESTGDDLPATLRKALYSSETITALAKGIYGAFSTEETSKLGAMLGIPGWPASLSRRLPARYAAAKSVLLRAKSWEKLGSVPWGFAKGNRSGFAAALTAVLQPVRPLVEAFLANGVFHVLGVIRVGGTNGYNNAVLPLLEALSCPKKNLKNYEDYIKGKGTDRILTDVLTPVLDLVDQVIDRPVYMLTKLLPNLVFFVQSGGLADCAEHLLTPVTLLLDALSLTPEDFGADLSMFRETDLSELLDYFSGDVPTVALLEDVDWALIASLGRETTEDSKRTYHDKHISVVNIKSDQSAVLLTLLRGIVTAMKRPENAEVMNTLVAQTGGGNAMFEQYAADISKQMEEMTTDELLEWLYDLLFRERAKKDIKHDDGYVPDFEYDPAPSRLVPILLITFGSLAVLTAAVVLWWRRREIAAWVNRRRKGKQQSRTSGGEG